MKSKWKWVACVIGIVIVAFIALIFDLAGGPTIVQEYIRHDKPENLSFSFSGCNDSTYPPEAVDSTSWAGDTLTVDVTITPNCGTTWLFGSYKIVGENDLILGYKTIAPTFIACNCDYTATYQISGLDKKNYNITIKEYAFINRYPASLRMLFDIGPDIVEVGDL